MARTDARRLAAGVPLRYLTITRPPAAEGAGQAAHRLRAATAASAKVFMAATIDAASGPVGNGGYEAVTSPRRSSSKDGYETDAAAMPSTSTPSVDARPATAASIAIRWSPRESNVPPRSEPVP